MKTTQCEPAAEQEEKEAKLHNSNNNKLVKGKEEVESRVASLATATRVNRMTSKLSGGVGAVTSKHSYLHHHHHHHQNLNHHQSQQKNCHQNQNQTQNHHNIINKTKGSATAAAGVVTTQTPSCKINNHSHINNSTTNTNTNTNTNIDATSTSTMSARYKFHNDCQSSVLTYEQVKRLDYVMDQVVPIHGRGQFPTLYVKLRELIRLVKYKLQQEHSIEICDVRLNGGAASYVLAPDSSQYNDLDLIFGCDLSDESRFDVIRDTVLECLREFYPMPSCVANSSASTTTSTTTTTNTNTNTITTSINNNNNTTTTTTITTPTTTPNIDINVDTTTTPNEKLMNIKTKNSITTTRHQMRDDVGVDCCDDATENVDTSKVKIRGDKKTIERDGSLEREVARRLLVENKEKFDERGEGEVEENENGKIIEKKKSSDGHELDGDVIDSCKARETNNIDDEVSGKRETIGQGDATAKSTPISSRQQNFYHHQMPLSYCAIKEAYVHKMVKVNDDDRWSLISLGVQQSDTTTTNNTTSSTTNCNTSSSDNNNTTTTTETTTTAQPHQQMYLQQQQPQHQQHMHYNQSTYNHQLHNHNQHNHYNQMHYQHHTKSAPNNIELKFVDRMRRKFEFSVDSFQIILDSLLQFYDYAPSVAANSSSASTTSSSSSSGCISSPASIINGCGGSSSGSRSPTEVASSASSVVSSSSSSLSCDEDQEDLYCSVDTYNESSITIADGTNSNHTTDTTTTTTNTCSSSSASSTTSLSSNSSTTSSLLSTANSILSSSVSSVDGSDMVVALVGQDQSTLTCGGQPVAGSATNTCNSAVVTNNNPITNTNVTTNHTTIGAAAASISENFYPTVIGRSEYGDFKEALYHLERKLIATKSPEEIRGGGLLKYCNLLVKNYKPTNVYQIRTLERYMCSRFFIDFSDVSQQQAKLESYLANHFSDDPLLKFDYLTILYNVVNRSTVCLMNHELRLTLNMIRDLAFKLGVEQQQLQVQQQHQQQLQQQQQHHHQQQQQQQQYYYYQPQKPVSIQSGVYRVKLVNYTLAKQQI